MDDVKKLLERQAAWQRSRKVLSWPEKIQIAEAIRESVVKLRRTGPAIKPGAAASERPQ